MQRFQFFFLFLANQAANQIGMEISKPIIACISDLAFKYTGIDRIIIIIIAIELRLIVQRSIFFCTINGIRLLENN